MCYMLQTEELLNRLLFVVLFAVTIKIHQCVSSKCEMMVSHCEENCALQKHNKMRKC